MSRLLSLVVAAAVVLGVASAENKKIVSLKRTSAPIVVDGSIDPAWMSADSISDFIQFAPFFDKAPTNRTVARLLSTPEALYCLVVAYSDPSKIQVNTGTLDESSGDIVSLMLDTFGDRRTAYKFAVSAAGVRSDCRLLDDARNRDYSWDGVWFSDTRVYDWGYVVEMEIPYRTIQYDESKDAWGVDFDRWIPDRNEDIYWCRYEENEGQRISKFGTMRFEGIRPAIKGDNLEIFPVGLTKATYEPGGSYLMQPTAGVDVFYNPSPKLTFQFTANPDFAQIEADPFDFNISRYESYFSERRPFFTQGNEVFMASGRQRNMGFYQPMELFYSRRIGKKLPDGSEVPLLVGTKAFGRLNEWEYGGFLAVTGQKTFNDGSSPSTEPQAGFGAVRVKRQILENSSVGILAVGKQSGGDRNGVIDIDGAFRSSNLQLAYQLARSDRNGVGGYALSAGLTQLTDAWIALGRIRSIGADFDISQVGYVPWRGTTNAVALVGPRWFYPEGPISSIMVYGGGALNYERADAYTDRSAVLGYNMQMRSNWGFEVDLEGGHSKDLDKVYDSYSVNYSVWVNSPQWWANMWGGASKSYNFSRNWLAYYSWLGASAGWKATTTLEVGTSTNAYVEGNPSNRIQDVTVDARPYISLTPVNDLNLRLYVDNVYVRSSDKLEQVIAGFLFSYNFLPKSWIYLALNEVQDRQQEVDALGRPLPQRLHVTARAGVLKLKYLYYL